MRLVMSLCGLTSLTLLPLSPWPYPGKVQAVFRCFCPPSKTTGANLYKPLLSTLSCIISPEGERED